MRWDVQVFGGVLPSAEAQASAPIRLAPPSVTLNSDGSLSDLEHDVVYEGVLLRTMSPGSLSMFGPPPKKPGAVHEALHVMEKVWQVNFTAFGQEVEGCEARRDGTLVLARWEISPAAPSEEDERLVREVFGQ